MSTIPFVGVERVPRVLHVINAFQMGGAERMLVNLFRVLERRGISDFHVCVLGPEGWYYQEYTPPHAPTYLDYTGTWRNPAAMRRLVHDLRDVIAKVAPEIVHSHLWFSHFVSAMAAEGPAHIAHIHNTWDWMQFDRPGYRLRGTLYKRALRKSNARFIACSDAAGAYHHTQLGIGHELMRTIEYGIDTEQFSPRPAGSEVAAIPVVGVAGRFVPEKGHMQLIHAAHLLKQRGVAFKLRIAGGGPLKPQYEALISDLDVSDKVDLVGSVRDMPAFYQSLDVYVQPSLSAEGLPLAILEALASGIPVVATDVAGAREAIRDGEEGRLLSKPTPDLLADALTQALTDPDWRLDAGRRARQRIEERFSATYMTDRVLNYYQDLLSVPAHA